VQSPTTARETLNAQVSITQEPVGTQHAIGIPEMQPRVSAGETAKIPDKEEEQRQELNEQQLAFRFQAVSSVFSETGMTEKQVLYAARKVQITDTTQIGAAKESVIPVEMGTNNIKTLLAEFHALQDPKERVSKGDTILEHCLTFDWQGDLGEMLSSLTPQERSLVSSLTKQYAIGSCEAMFDGKKSFSEEFKHAKDAFALHMHTMEHAITLDHPELNEEGLQSLISETQRAEKMNMGLLIGADVVNSHKKDAWKVIQMVWKFVKTLDKE
jgi:hypothetical protein